MTKLGIIWDQATSGLEAVGGTMQKAGQAIVAPVTRTAATTVRAGRGAVALAGAGGRALSGDRAGTRAILAQEGQQQQMENAGPDAHRPVETMREAIGVGMQLGILWAAPSAAAVGVPMGAGAGTVLGGASGLVSGAGQGLETAGRKRLGIFDTVSSASWGGMKGAAVGATVGGAAGAAYKGMEKMGKRVKPKSELEVLSEGVDDLSNRAKAGAETMRSQTEMLKADPAGEFGDLEK